MRPWVSAAVAVWQGELEQQRYIAGALQEKLQHQTLIFPGRKRRKILTRILCQQ